ncbi:MAG: ABC transporter substrate-binding protein [Geobacteraceae bacterium]|nr:ABC transporter substrate-binding protein [Geobacteraceae bacterium]NTW79035.1 ABC transporter substrate-binding protein [Geobacteraceae bacterium]
MNLSYPTLKTPLLMIELFTLLFFLSATSLFAAAPPPPNLPQGEIMRLGERMYREGVLPSGAPMPAFIRGDVEVDSTAFSCSSCHLRAGLGSFEGGVITPPTTGNKLYKPYIRPPSLGVIADRDGRDVYAKTVLERPPYNRETLATALRFGTDPTGHSFNDVMPRYPLADNDMSILINYLELLSKEPSPGASKDEFRFATIITDDVSQEDRQALLRPLQQFIAQKNQQLGMYNDFIKFGYTPTAEMKYAFRRASLDIWELKGPPTTWQKQLAAYNNNKPVFAVLGGISNSDWRPIHDFCEAERLPCLFPITDFPVISETGWYTYYFNKGFAQEGEAVARYLNRMENLSADTPIIQIVQDSPAGRALAAGFDKNWNEVGRPAVTTITLTASQLVDPAALAKILTKHKPGVLLFWTEAGLLQNLPALIARLPATEMVFVSSSYLGRQTANIAENIRNKVFITFPYRLNPYVGTKTGGFDAKIPILTGAKDFGDRRIASRTTAMLQQATLQGLNMIYDNLYRDHLFDVMSMQMDLVMRDYERFSFGPGQRYVSKGCYIIQLGPGENPTLLPRSEWVVQ